MVLLILGLLFVFLMPSSTVLLNNQKRDLTRQRLKNIETALANFVAINKRLPCPADGADTSGTELRTAGTPDCTTGVPASTEQKRGVVPWVPLGLTASDVQDGWNNQITYRAAFGLTQDSALDMSACDPAGTANTTPAGVSPLPPTNTVINTNKCNSALICTGTGTACSNPQMFLANKGFTVVDGADATIMDPSSYSGAAYVLISHGENGMRAFSNSQILIAAPANGESGALEALNYNSGNAVNSVSTTVSPKFRDATASWGAVAVYFDDLVVRPAVFSLIQRAQLGPRSH
jgi:type II secretory pathway pseudopilin PulG